MGGVGVQVNESTATSGGSVKATVGTGATLPATVSISASGGTTFDVVQAGGLGALIGGGDNAASATSSMAIEAAVGDGAGAPAG